MEAITELKNLASRIEDPPSFYEGPGPRLSEMPRNVVLFHRSRLQSGHERDFQHHRFMLIVNLKTVGRICLDERVIRFPGNHALLVFPYQLHHYLTIDIPISWLFITFELASSTIPSALRNRVLPLHPTMVTTLTDVMKAYAEDRLHPPVRLGPGLAYVISSLADQLPAQDDLAAPAPRHRDERSLVERVNRYIYPRLSEPLSIDQVADAVGLSASHLRTRFRAVMGDSLGRYIRRVKINRATSLLRDSDLSVGSVATDCGYASVFSFSRSFRRVVGCSPKQFRERHQ